MRHTVESHMASCGCRSAGECSHNWFAETKALEALVDDFAIAMKQKLLRKMREGGCSSGPFVISWDDPQWTREEIKAKMQSHLARDEGQMVDIANFAMFAWNQEEG